MEQFIASLPKSIVAIGALLIGFLLIVLNDPPKTICDSQIEIFRASQKRFLYSKIYAAKDEVVLSVKEKFDVCRDDNSPGGCFELFEGLKRLSVDLDNIPNECSETAAGDPELRKWLLKSLKMMVQMAWGDRAPASYLQKQGWFDTSDLVLYCNLKRNAQRIYGESEFVAWREAVMKDLPQANTLSREVMWQKTILSTPCDAYR